MGPSHKLLSLVTIYHYCSGDIRLRRIKLYRKIGPSGGLDNLINNVYYWIRHSASDVEKLIIIFLILDQNQNKTK